MPRSPRTSTLLAGLLIAGAVQAGAVQTAPLQYQFSAMHLGELVPAGDGNYTLVAESEYLIANGVTTSGTFFYDNSVNAFATDLYDIEFAAFGRFSVYDSAATRIDGSIAALGYGYGATSGYTVVANSNQGERTDMDGVFNTAGSFNGSSAGAGFHGFSIGDYTLVSLNIFTLGPFDYLADQALPDTLRDGGFNTGVNLIFKDSQQQMRVVQFYAGSLAPVPGPTSGLLLGSGLLALASSARRRQDKKRR